MAWSNTYTHTIAVAVDVFTASILWNSYDVTISSRCGLALRGVGGHPEWMKSLGRLLNKIQANHCELAIQADMQRAKNAIAYLSQK